MNDLKPAARIDLNLFRVFDAIWRTGSLTLAAEQLHLTQPAVSNALARLREHFGDALFRRQGRRVVPTARAQAIADDVGEALRLLRDSLQSAQAFDALASSRRFTLGMRDNFEVSLLPRLVLALRQHAPRMHLHSAAIDRKRLARQLAEGEMDFGIDVPVAMPADIRQAPLLEIDFCLATRPGHRFAKRRPSVKEWAEAEHVAVSGRSAGPVMEDLALQRAGLTRDVSVRLQNYYAACHLVAASDLVLVLPRFYGEWFSGFIPLHLAATPLPLPPMPILLYWHRNADSDAGHAWLRELILRLRPG